MQAKDLNPIQVEYVSFASWETNLVKFYFNCTNNFAIPEIVSSLRPPQHIEGACRTIDSAQHDYKEFFKLADIANARSEGFIINFLFYIKARLGAHILFTKEPIANLSSYEYEIGKL